MSLCLSHIFFQVLGYVNIYTPIDYKSVYCHNGVKK